MITSLDAGGLELQHGLQLLLHGGIELRAEFLVMLLLSGGEVVAECFDLFAGEALDGVLAQFVALDLVRQTATATGTGTAACCRPDRFTIC